MDWIIILLGLSLGFIIAKHLSANRTPPPRTIPTDNSFTRTITNRRNIIRPPPRIDPHRIPPPPSHMHVRIPRPGRIHIDMRPEAWEPVPARLREMTNREQNIVREWRKSIVGLIKLADRNLAASKQHLRARRFQTSIHAASTAVENIARAFIHCFGGKPDPGSGQEEPLRMLSRRLKGDEKRLFEETIANVARIDHNKSALQYLTTHRIENQLFNLTKAREVHKHASKIVQLFRRIITEHFATEIPELANACPKCHSLNISTWNFDQDKVKHGCNNCNHTWNEPRDTIRCGDTT